MKVLFVNHFPLTGSGSGVYTANIAKGLIRKGHEVAVVFPENRSEYEKYEKMNLYPVFFKNQEIISGVNQSKMNFPCFTTHPRSVFNFRDMSEQERKEYEEKFYEAINNAIKEFKPDIIHAQHVWTLAGISAKCCKEHNIPMIITCHGTDLMGVQDEEKRNENWGTHWAKEAAQYANTIVTISKDSHQLAEEVLPETKGKTKWIRNGVDMSVFSIDENVKKSDVLKSIGIEKDYSKVVSFVGKLTDFKGVDVLLDAAAIYEKENEDVLTIIAGDGELRNKLEGQAQRLNLKNVKFIGNQPQSKLKEIYNIANCSCVPSRREPFGLVAIEAMACGAPVVATNEGGLPDFVKPDVGRLVDVEDSKALANSVTQILKGNITFNRKAISEKMEKNYSQDALIGEFVNTYNEAIHQLNAQKHQKSDGFEPGD